MKRIIIYAKGQVFQIHKKDIVWENVLVIADKNAVDGETINGVNVILPDRISDYEYDYIAVFSNSLFEKIRYDLIGNFFIPEDKIVSWHAAVSDRCIENIISTSFRQIISEKKIKSILDIGMPVLPKIYYRLPSDFENKVLKIDGVGDKKYPFYNNIYNHIYPTIDECNDKYEMVIIWEWTRLFENHLSLICKKARYVLISISYLTLNTISMEEQRNVLSKFGYVRNFSDASGIIWFVDTNKECSEFTDTRIYVVTHKPYNVLKDNIYTPICVGDNYHKAGYLKECYGENISYLNDKINECTALYWIWKNTDSKYVGLNHYRRYFCNDDIKNISNCLSAERIHELMMYNDVILPKLDPLQGMTVLDEIKNSISPEAFEQGFENIRNSITKNQPEYSGAFEDVMNGYRYFHFNMFVTKYDIMNKYCEWLFSFLIEAAEATEVSLYDNYSKRVIGFFAERMWTVWLMKQDLKVAELPGIW